MALTMDLFRSKPKPQLVTPAELADFAPFHLDPDVVRVTGELAAMQASLKRLDTEIAAAEREGFKAKLVRLHEDKETRQRDLGRKQAQKTDLERRVNSAGWIRWEPHVNAQRAKIAAALAAFADACEDYRALADRWIQLGGHHLTIPGLPADVHRLHMQASQESPLSKFISTKGRI